jgi:hypothetical protein
VRNLILAVLLMLGANSFGAVGDITGADIEDNGWVARLWVSGLNTNGNIFNGFVSSNDPGRSPKLVFKLLSNGYNADGTTNITPRLVYGTHVIRFAWSNAAAGGPPGPHTNQIFTDGNGCIVRLALSDYVCSKDGVTLDALAGAYAVTNAGPTNSIAITGLAVTNGSQQAYPKTLAFPQTVPWQTMAGNQYKIDIIAGSYFAADGFPVRSVHFWGVDADGHRSPTNVETRPIMDMTKPTPTLVYRSFVWQTNFTSGVRGTNFTNYVKVFPRIGDSASVWDSSDGTYNADAPYLGPQVFFCNISNWYSQCFAVVDRTNGVAAGTIATNLAGALTALPFTNIQTALDALAVTNLTLYGKSNWDNCVILLTNGLHGFTSDPDAPTTITRLENPSWVTISNYPGVAKTDCVIMTNRGATSVQKLSKIKFSGLTLNWIPNSAFDGQGRRCIWWDNCLIKTNSAGTGDAISSFNTNIWATGCTFERNRYGLKPQGAPSSGLTPLSDRWHVWGNTFTCFLESCCPASFIGNRVVPLTNSPTSIRNDVTGTGTFNPWCYSFNSVLRCDATALPLAIGLNITNQPVGILVWQNVVEIATNGSSPPFDVMQSATPFEGVTNMLVWNNTTLCNYHPPFNHQSNQATLFSPFYSHVGNAFNDFELGMDGSASGSPGDQNPFRTNRWNLVYGVGNIGNAMAELNANDATPESGGTAANAGFNGLFNGYYATNNTSNAWSFVNHAAMIGTTSGNGNGNYRLQTKSPLFILAPGRTGWVSPYDMDGYPRSVVDPPGAYISGNAKKGGLF